jgi:hypothetical protein
MGSHPEGSLMHRDVASMTADRASGAAFGVRGGFFMMTTIITMTTRFPGASG